MNFLALGLLLGIASVSAPGPITMGLIQFSSVQKRSRGHLAGLGISAGDIAAIAAAVALITAGTAVPEPVMMTIQGVSIGYLFVVGLALLFKTKQFNNAVGNINHPARAFFLATSLNPSVFGSWLAILLAMPFATEPSHLTIFAAGVALASFLWFQFVAVGVATFAHRLTDRHLIASSRLGGVITLAFGVWAATNIVP